MIVNGTGAKSGPDEVSDRSEVRLEVSELDKLGREVELKTIVGPEELIEARKVDEEERVLVGDEAKLLLLVLLLLDVVVTDWGDSISGDVAAVSLLIKAVTVRIAEEVAYPELIMVLVIVEDVGADTAVPRRRLLEVSSGMIVVDAAIETMLLERATLDVRLVATGEDVPVE
ncbi:hypothetical protein MMC11_003434 [Xylographa trunciseda]|nr:hypothetical protein [Xylographa trunciseda]